MYCISSSVRLSLLSLFPFLSLMLVCYTHIFHVHVHVHVCVHICIYMYLRGTVSVVACTPLPQFRGETILDLHLCVTESSGCSPHATDLVSGGEGERGERGGERGRGGEGERGRGGEGEGGGGGGGRGRGRGGEGERERGGEGERGRGGEGERERGRGGEIHAQAIVEKPNSPPFEGRKCIPTVTIGASKHVLCVEFIMSIVVYTCRLQISNPH